MKRELAAFLQEIARVRPLVLFIDYWHLADVSTVDVLNYLAGRFDLTRLLILVTYRPSEMMLSRHPFLQVKLDLQSRGVFRELALEFLALADVERYLALQFPVHRLPDAFAKLIHDKTEGNPLFLTDLIRYLRDRGVIAKDRDHWQLARSIPDVERELPETVRSTISRKIAQSLMTHYRAEASGMASELAFLFEAARDFKNAAQFFHGAALHALSLFAYREAVLLCRRGLAMVKALPESPERAQQELGLQVMLGLSLRSIEGWAAPEVEKIYTRARQLC